MPPPQRHSFKNRVVAATGTGKTVIDAFDTGTFAGQTPIAQQTALCRPTVILIDHNEVRTDLLNTNGTA
ncbi:hypothetical protein DOT_1431 [Desulfosporosinus sp. OT]|nr:hypothetical protein DOT_1431 [Desulfosporosinus sp. OT]